MMDEQKKVVLEWARKKYEQADDVEKKNWEFVFPELKESEDDDERIRKDLLAVIRHCYEDGGYALCTDDYEEYSAYLEKKKEDVEKEYVFRPLAGTDITIAAEQSIRRAKAGEHLVLAFNDMYTPVSKYDSAKGLVDKYNTYLEKQQPAEWSEEDEEMFERFLGWLQGTMGEKTYSSWLKSLRERFSLEPKQEWSEEDERMLTNIIARGSSQVPTYEPALREDQMEWLMNRLRYLRPQPHWKPSEEQMEALNEVIHESKISIKLKTKLILLENDLKSL